MDLIRLRYLYNRHKAKCLTASEREEWESIVLDPAYTKAIETLMQDGWTEVDGEGPISGDKDPRQEQAFRYIVSQQQTGSRRQRPWARWPYAAAILALVTIGLWLADPFTGGDFTADRLGMEPVTDPQVLPGGNKAKLTLPDGRTVNLSANHDGIVVADGAINYFNGDLVVVHAEDRKSVDDTPQMLTLTVPRGGTYRVTLPDGSNVWLNAGSTLRYPNRFGGRERDVELIGEAYFEVAKAMGSAFRVITAGQHIQVLGTQFNVSAYHSEPTIKTTLVEGSVRVTNIRAGVENTLEPGQQSVVADGETRILNVATAQYTAWKDGYFAFDATPFPEVLEQLSRWYDIEIEYKKVPGMAFSGTMKRDVQLESILEFFGNSGIRYRMEGRKLIVE